MTGSWIRHVLDLLFYGGFFIGCCAGSLTALTLDLSDQIHEHVFYIYWIGTATAALYCGHRLIGLHHVEQVHTSARFQAVRDWQKAIKILAVFWAASSIYFFFRHPDIRLLMTIMPGGAIALAYILPVFGHGRRLRDLGWFKIILIAWSWSWLTAFVPSYFLADSSFGLSIMQGVERFLFIFAITIPFEIRDITIDRAVGLHTLPAKLGKPATTRWVWMACIVMVMLSYFIGWQFGSQAYYISHLLIGLLVLLFYHWSWNMHDDYFFSGAVDGLMIMVWVLYLLFEWL